MNKIYSIKYSAATGGLIAVSDLAKKVTCKTNRKISAALLSLAVISYTNIIHAANMDISKAWARDYLDLAQNKGRFQPGSTHVKIKLKDGTDFSFPAFPVPDFSSATANGAATSIGGAYAVTVAHNAKNKSSANYQTYGSTQYTQINRMTTGNDFSIQRLNKYVVETRGADTSFNYNENNQNIIARYGVDVGNGKKEIIGFRVGSGNTTFSGIKTSQTYQADLLSASLFHITNLRANTVGGNKLEWLC